LSTLNGDDIPDSEALGWFQQKYLEPSAGPAMKLMLEYLPPLMELVQLLGDFLLRDAYQLASYHMSKMSGVAYNSRHYVSFRNNGPQQ
jgi:hypothetical protein